VVLARVAAYVQTFVNGFTNVVAEEDFRQERSGSRRRLTSDFLLVQYPGLEREFLSFRDVAAVNGRPVRDQQDRLAKLFLEPFADARRRAEEITQAGSRHSLVPLGALSNPLLVIAFLQAHYQPQFRFALGPLEPDLGTRVRRLEFVELVVPAPERSARRAPPMAGKAWIDETTGRVLKTEIRTGVAPNTGITTVTFKFDPELGIDVPGEMLDSRADFRGLASYGRFRRFQVRTEEAIDEPQAR
jgi:hypothetical protein